MSHASKDEAAELEAQIRRTPIPEHSWEELKGRYNNDPVFHALVYLMSEWNGGGFADDEGVRHPGPTVADAALVQKFLDALDSINYEITVKVET